MNQSDIIIFTTADEQVELNVRLEDDTVWLIQEQMATLFDKNKRTISEHIRNVFKEGELSEKVVVRKFRTTTKHGAIAGKTQSVSVNGYNLDVIISVGYRVKSQKGTQFRIWATQRLAENKQQFLQTLDDLKILTQGNDNIATQDILSLIQTFSDTWFTLESYDKQQFPQQDSVDSVQTSAEELYRDLQVLKNELMNKGEATALFAQEKTPTASVLLSATFFKVCLGKMPTQLLRKKPPTCYTLSSKNTHLMTATNAAAHLPLFGCCKNSAMISKTKSTRKPSPR